MHRISADVLRTESEWKKLMRSGKRRKNRREKSEKDQDSGNYRSIRSPCHFVTLTVTCSKGTYIRTLCHDIGEKLGCGGCMESLLAPVSALYIKRQPELPEIEKLQESGKIEQILMPVDAVFMQYPCVSILEEQEKILRNGNPFRVREMQNLLPEGQNVDELEKDRIRVYDTGGQFCAIYEYREEKGMFFPVKMFL